MFNVALIVIFCIVHCKCLNNSLYKMSRQKFEPPLKFPNYCLKGYFEEISIQETIKKEYASDKTLRNKFNCNKHCRLL